MKRLIKRTDAEIFYIFEFAVKNKSRSYRYDTACGKLEKLNYKMNISVKIIYFYNICLGKTNYPVDFFVTAAEKAYFKRFAYTYRAKENKDYLELFELLSTQKKNE